MTAATARARDTPGRTPARQTIAGLLIIDLEHRGAYYECYRPGCPKPLEEPIRPSAAKPFIDGIKARHLREYHGGTP